MKRTAYTHIGENSWMPGIVARHTSFFVLMGVLLGQLLLLSFQVTRNQNVRLISVWAETVFGPFEQGLHDVVEGTAESCSAVRDLWSYRQTNRKLGSELVEARAQILELSEKAAEADRLKALLDFRGRLPYSSLAAEVIATSPGGDGGTIVINRGRNAGLKVDLPVITPQGVVGKIAAVYHHSAQVLLITDPSCAAGCILEKSRLEGILKGRGRNRCSLHYVMDEEKVPVGEAVLTSGLDEIYPKGLLVGYVIRAKDGNIYKRIDVKPAASFDRLENVLVLFKSTSKNQEQALNLERP
ncbi:MAG: rod shape-determining protein MreC [Acidobacteriota bacterium]